MDFKNILNLIISALGAGILSFIGYFTAGGELNKAGIMAALGAALAAAINHLRKPPIT